MSSPDPPHPDEVKKALAEAEQRATDTLEEQRLANRRRIRRWILVGIFAYVLQSVGVGLVLTFVVINQRTQAENSANGRATLQALLGYSDPTSKTFKDAQSRSATQTVSALIALHAANQQDVVDVLHKVGEWMSDLGLPASEVARVETEPFPPVTFTFTPPSFTTPIPLPSQKPAAPRPPPRPSPPRPSPAHAAPATAVMPAPSPTVFVSRPSSTATPAPGPPCPPPCASAIVLEPLNAALVCIPPPPTHR